MPKYVVSSTLKVPKWSNSTVLSGNVVNEVSRLKQELDGDLLVYASYQLVRTLIEHDLADELRLMVFPVVLGAGERLFGGTSGKKPMRLLSTQTIGEGLAFLTYQLIPGTRQLRAGRTRHGTVYATSCGFPPPPELDVLGPPAGISTVLPKTAIGAFVDVGNWWR